MSLPEKLFAPDDGLEIPNPSEEKPGVEEVPVAEEHEPTAPPAGPEVPEEAFAKRLEQEKQKIISQYQDYDRMKNGVERAAKIAGYASVDEFILAVDEAEKAAEKKRLNDAGISNPDAINELIEKHPTVKRAKEIAEKEQLDAEVVAFAGEFEDLFGRKVTNEDVSDEVFKYRKAKECTLSEAFFFVNRGNLKTLLAQEKETAAATALAEAARQSKRGVESSGGAPPPPEESFDFTSEELTWAKRGVRRGTYKDLKEAWTWLRNKN